MNSGETTERTGGTIEYTEKKCEHPHCRCMNLDKQCPNFHYADCNAEYIIQERRKSQNPEIPEVVNELLSPSGEVEVEIQDTPKMGRPTLFTKELADEICAELATGLSLRTVCKPDEMPSIRTIFYWLRTNEDFLHQYEKAKAEGADALVDEILEIADDGTNDWMERERQDGSIIDVPNSEHIQRSRLRVDARKWIASKLKPKKYGDKMDLTTDNKPINIIFDSAFNRDNDNPNLPPV